jgi:hypothetical protein
VLVAGEGGAFRRGRSGLVALEEMHGERTGTHLWVVASAADASKDILAIDDL